MTASTVTADVRSERRNQSLFFRHEPYRLSRSARSEKSRTAEADMTPTRHRTRRSLFYCDSFSGASLSELHVECGSGRGSGAELVVASFRAVLAK
jgi:hypothetical protein